ncbi:casein kinase 1 epsilon [Metarhizium acridum CQMa 102]|uniref:Casein kinase 1 epsilon n=1 Tax=Metarhizium acridum (strain CQMa 102) TaxID=655827 RepID=E9EBE4_METAQ|nr:casein kinase 1 epsilon [Metarhizium acridum CQMa 102]EFY86788.1 casein kinase 1 epsilon [Metarhizium acridum CQMa 102]
MDEKIEQSWGDDLESLGYVLLYFACGSLPWQGLKASTDKERSELIKQKKKSTSVESLCDGLPEEFTTYIKYTRSLQPTDKPNYASLLKLFSGLFATRGFKYDNPERSSTTKSMSMIGGLEPERRDRQKYGAAVHLGRLKGWSQEAKQGRASHFVQWVVWQFGRDLASGKHRQVSSLGRDYPVYLVRPVLGCLSRPTLESQQGEGMDLGLWGETRHLDFGY